MKRLCIMVLSLILALSLVPVQSFASEIIPSDKTGSITLTLKYDGKPIKDGSFSCIQVADVVSEDADYYFRQLLGDKSILRDGLPKADDMYQSLMEDRVFYILHKETRTNTTGTVKFEALEPGLYLILQEKPSEGFTAVSPFLVSVPYMDTDGTYKYDVDASVKAELYKEPETVPTTPTTQPTQPVEKLPQTGQTTWPIPLLASGGMMLFSLGWWLTFGRRKESGDA